MTKTANPAPTRIQNAVMRRVRIIAALRPFISNLAGALYLLTLSLYMLGREVFVAQVWRNMPSLADAGAVARFVEGAVLNTEVSVQLILTLIIIGNVWLFSEFVSAHSRRLPIGAGLRI
jgi:hypothetical protein